MKVAAFETIFFFTMHQERSRSCISDEKWRLKATFDSNSSHSSWCPRTRTLQQYDKKKSSFVTCKRLWKRPDITGWRPCHYRRPRCSGRANTIMYVDFLARQIVLGAGSELCIVFYLYVVCSYIVASIYAYIYYIMYVM